MRLNRRSLLAAIPLTCAPRAAWAQNLSTGMFTHGVASGDPLMDGVIIWTRFVSAEGRVAWEIAEDDSFARVVQRGATTASPVNDYCVKVDVRGLAPGRQYFYRFLSTSGPSLTGHTRTAGGDALRVAVFSCANYAFGYFHAYGHAALRDDIDLVLHTGDYIYEYGRGTYPAERDAVPERRLIDPAGETITLNDYYQRYALYHTDADLLLLRQMKPISAVWDDHEITNNTWRDGAQNHQANEGSWADRIAAASKAYFDWMPIRRPEARGARIYRALDWGDLARIVLLDTRYIGRDQELSFGNLASRLAQGGADAEAALTEARQMFDAPSRTLLGEAQERWLTQTLAESKQRGQTWQILTQQVIVANQVFPVGTTRFLPTDANNGTRAWVSGSEHLGAAGFGWNLDAWSGYRAARTRLLNDCVTHANNAVILGGDSHNTWINSLAAPGGGRLAALEFAGGSVTSPGFERSMAAAAAGEREQHMRSGNPELAFCDLTSRGYGALHFTRARLDAEWVAFDNVRGATANAPHTTRLQAEPSTTAGPSAWTL